MKAAKELHFPFTNNPKRKEKLDFSDIDYSVSLSGSREVLDALELCMRPGLEGIEFIISGDSVRSTTKPYFTLAVGPRVDISTLIALSVHHRISFVTEEGHAVTIEGARTRSSVADDRTGWISVDFDGDTVRLIFSSGPGVVDVNGNKVGARLIDANKTDKLKCEGGMFDYCESAVVSGLTYIVEDDRDCTFFIPSEAGLTTIPQCSRIGGFMTRAFREPASDTE